MRKSLLFLLAGLCFLTGCDQEKQASDPTQSTSSNDITQPTSSDVSAWMGKWDGPEGTFLEIAERKIGYKITIQNLDGPREFDGTENDGVIEFKRDGRTEIIRPGDGAATGMKWLAEKKSCLVVTYGEGYCRG